MMPTPRVLANVVDQLDGIEMTDTDTKGDLYPFTHLSISYHLSFSSILQDQKSSRKYVIPC